MWSQILFACSLVVPALVRAQTIDLGTARPYGVLGATTVTNTGLTVINGDLGVTPGTAITGFPPGVATGNTNSANAIAAAAKADALAAYNAVVALATDQDLTGQDLGGLKLGPGVYKYSSSAQLTGILILDAGGNPDAQFIFQIASTITTASASEVQLINGAQACNAIFQIGSSATFGTGTKFMGAVLANTAITVTTGVSNVGPFVAINAAVTLDSNQIRACDPAAVRVSSASVSATSTSATMSTGTSNTAPASTSSAFTSTTSATTPTKPTSTSRSSTATSTKSSTSQTATSTSICVAPGEPHVGGILPPRCGCNDVFSDWLVKPFKVYSGTSKFNAVSYLRNDVIKACKDACDQQWKSCQDVYAESCRGKTETKDRDSYASATKKCQKQKDSCRKLNDKHDKKNECSSFGVKFRRT